MPMPLTPRTVRRSVRALHHTVTNAVEIARFGGLATGEQPSPFAVRLISASSKALDENAAAKAEKRKGGF